MFSQFSTLAFFIWQTADDQIRPEQFQSGGSLIWMFVQTIFALGFVCLLAYIILSVVLPRIQSGGVGKRMVQVVDRTPLDQRRSLYVVEVTGRYLLIAASEGGVTLISELDAEKAEQEAAAKIAPLRSMSDVFGQVKGTARTSFSDVLARMVNRKQ